MTSKIKELSAELDALRASQQHLANNLRQKLQAEYNAVFNDSKALAKAIANAENSSEYQGNGCGDIESWYRWSGLSEYVECKEYFETWLIENSSMRVDWDNECFLLSHGDDNIIIQDDTTRDNGVWQSGKLVIAEREYRNPGPGENEYGLRSGEVDIEKRNELIEKHMEKTGYFPGVFRVTQYCDVYPVNTQKRKVG